MWTPGPLMKRKKKIKIPSRALKLEENDGSQPVKQKKRKMASEKDRKLLKKFRSS